MTVALAAARGPVYRATHYLTIAVIGHLVWETAHVRLYTIWWDGTAREIVIAVIHCTVGDVMISTATLLIAALMARFCGWHLFGWRMIASAIILGIAYTILSEWLNIEVWRSWSYTSAMPVLPWIGTGLSPLFQWVVVPALAFGAVHLTTVRESQSPSRSV